MGFVSNLFRIPRPQVRLRLPHISFAFRKQIANKLQSFFYTMSLRTGTELIAFSLLFNKVSGLYGLIALVTGFHLSPIQLSMYIYSLLAFILAIYLFPHIRKQSPFQNVLLAWFYILDSLVNSAYTAAFALSWILTISTPNETKGPGAATISDTAGFTNPEFNVSAVAVDGLKPGQDTVIATTPATSPSGAAGSPTLGRRVLLLPESVQSFTIIILLLILRIYFVLIVLSYARFVLRAHIANISRQNTALHTGSSDANTLENPFSPHQPAGQGWKGRLGRVMVAIGRSYWLGGESGAEDEIRWMDAVGGKFRKSGESTSLEAGTMNIERERRRRSGTGPPAPPPGLTQAQPGMLGPDQAQQSIKLQNMSVGV